MKIHLLKYLPGDFNFLKNITDQLILESRISPVTIEMEDKFFLHSGIQNLNFEYSLQYLSNFRANCISFFSKLHDNQQLVESIVFKDCNLHPDIEKIIREDILSTYPEIELHIHLSNNYDISNIKEQLKNHKYKDNTEYRYNIKKMEYLYDNYFKYYNPDTYITEFTNPENPKKAIMVDIDGTVSVFNKQRIIFDIMNSQNDTVVKPMKKIIELYSNDNVEIIFLTSRDDKYRDVTYNWLKNNIMNHKEFKLFMKNTGDNRNDFEIKKQIYLENIANDYNILAVFEDRTNVVNMWRSLGLFCLQPIMCEY